ncbi:MAG: crotonase/enoyl-CoA hydratase family protein [Neomegalonema sp.]|nr:crotonase/enoyl-CoA hydratase family protein [Neomegalonema sp.]
MSVELSRGEAMILTLDERGVATLTLNRPDKRNALSPRLLDEVAQATADINASSEIRVVVLAAAGDVFCAGGDLDWMREQMSATREQRIDEARRLALTLNGLNELKKPLIGRLQGHALGGGVGLACVCDVAIAAAGAKFGLTETRLGLIPATISPYVIARLGEGVARRVFMSARIFDAAEAAELGIVAKAVAADQLDAAVEAEIEPYFTASSVAVAAAKKMARGLGPSIDTLTIEETIMQLADTWETDDAREGVAAFFEKRKPRWAPS